MLPIGSSTTQSHQALRAERVTCPLCNTGRSSLILSSTSMTQPRPAATTPTARSYRLQQAAACGDGYFAGQLLRWDGMRSRSGSSSSSSTAPCSSVSVRRSQRPGHQQANIPMCCPDVGRRTNLHELHSVVGTVHAPLLSDVPKRRSVRGGGLRLGARASPQRPELCSMGYSHAAAVAGRPSPDLSCILLLLSSLVAQRAS